MSELAYRDYIANGLPNHEYLGDAVRSKLIYYPTVTREPFMNRGRLTDLIENRKLFHDIDMPPLNRDTDRAMVCGSQDMLRDVCKLLEQRGFVGSPGLGQPGDFVIERAFTEK